MPSQTFPDTARPAPANGLGDDRSQAAPPASDVFAVFGAALRQSFPSREALLAEACAQTAARRRKRRQLGAASALALAACFLGMLAWQNPVLHSQTLQTAVGEQRRLDLPDGSTVVLNTDTTVAVEYRLRSRDLRLDRGEAAFTVASDWRSFVVRSGPAWVRDIGTAFNVHRTDDGSSVTVLHGRIEVARLQPDGAPAPHRRTLHARQSLRIPDDAAQPVAAPVDVDLARAMAWQQGRIVFDGTPLSQVIAEMRRYRPGEITLADAGLATLRLSGVYDTVDADALLDALARALPVVIRRQADGAVAIHALPPTERHGRAAKK